MEIRTCSLIKLRSLVTNLAEKPFMLFKNEKHVKNVKGNRTQLETLENTKKISRLVSNEC